MSEKNSEQQMVDALPIGAAVFTGEAHTILAVNELMLAIWGRDASVIGKTLHEAIPELDGQPFHELMTDIYRTGQTYHNPNGKAQLLIDGVMSTVYFDFSFKPLLDQNGIITGIVNTAVDTTQAVKDQRLIQELNDQLVANIEEQTAINEELQESNKQLTETIRSLWTTNEQLSLAQDATKLGMFDWDMEHGGPLIWDQRCAELFWRSSGGIVDYDLDFVARLHPDDREATVLAVNNAFNFELSGGGYDVEYRTVNPIDGQIKWISAVGRALFNDRGEVSRFIGTVMDITANVQLREDLRSQEEQLRLAVNSAELGTWYIALDDRRFLPSPRLKELFGFHPEEEMPFNAAVDQIVDTHREQVIQAVEEAIRTEGSYDLEYPITGYHDQVLRWVRATGQVYPASKNSAAHFSGTISDITERKINEQRRSDFIGVVSHELRTPLTSLSGYIQVIQAKAKKSSDQSILDIAERTKRQIERMKVLITGFLDVARIGDSKIQLNKSQFDMAQLVKSAEEESLVTVTTHRVVFRPVEYTPVFADRDKIEQVLINLINNAVKYSPRDSTINVSCYTTDLIALVKVSDEGIGISPSDQARIFDRFYRVERDEIKQVSGFGIGLYISKDIIESHGGTIGVDSEVGKGSTFWFKLGVLNN